MKYLFFDLEFATTKNGIGKICEFGYTVTDGLFSVLERGNLIVNPNIGREDWDYYSVHHILTRTISEYESRDTFLMAYPTIYRLISGADYVFGHSMDGDVKFLNCDIDRYRLPAIDFAFYDIKHIFRKLTETEKDTSVNGILDYFGIESTESTHDAGGDSFNTMLAFRAILNHFCLSAAGALEQCPEAYDRTTGLVVESIAQREELKRQKRASFEAQHPSSAKRKGKTGKNINAEKKI